MNTININEKRDSCKAIVDNQIRSYKYNKNEVLTGIVSADKIYLSQRTDRHVVKRLDSEYTYEQDFGTFGTLQIDNTGLNFPKNIAADPAHNIYVCDMNNKRIVKLDMDLVYVSNLDVSTEIGRPHTIVYDSVSGDLYVVGIKDNITISIARIPTTLASVSKYDSDIYDAANNKPNGLSVDFTAGYFIISGTNDLLKVEETGGGFNDATIQVIEGEEDSKFDGHIMHSNGFLYLNTRRVDGARISRVNSSYQNTGDSNKISRLSSLVTEGLNDDVLVYDNANFIVKRYDHNLNFVEDVFEDTGATVSTDAESISGILEIDTTI